ncbi:MAG: methylated-DNA--[protein]-cysteine S-methyltransferase [Chitinophagales bacterium]|jgi:AraC family transcriptional regulator of adaptative response/methylated-DNA-[protein]-cysteine methyltransferase|nr:methylated-DNA--[protein]-cysteine S-methyltransferase [Chitinophagales bacterium]
MNSVFEINSPFGPIYEYHIDGLLAYVYLETGLHNQKDFMSKVFPNFSFKPIKLVEKSWVKEFLSQPNIFEFPWEMVYLNGYTEFQISVWRAMTQIEFGKMASYETLATQINRPKAFRAVGTAVGSNPFSLVVPCHRVVRKSGDIGQYLWGQETKKAILNWEYKNNL